MLDFYQQERILMGHQGLQLEYLLGHRVQPESKILGEGCILDSPGSGGD